MMDQSAEHQPQVISIELFVEGGFTFLRRALRTALADDTGEVIIDTHGLKLTYRHGPDNVTFLDGITSVVGESPVAYEKFAGVAGQYLVQQGLAELAEEARSS